MRKYVIIRIALEFGQNEYREENKFSTLENKPYMRKGSEMTRARHDKRSLT